MIALVQDGNRPDDLSRGWASLFPLVHAWYWQAAVVVGAVLVAMLLSGRIVMYLVGPPPPPTTPTPGGAQATRPRDAGRVIGKCENILIIILVLMGEYQGLGLVLAAKSIARIEAVKENASYYLGGTLVNLVWSVAIGVAARLIVAGL